MWVSHMQGKGPVAPAPMHTVDVQLFALTKEMLGPSALHELPAGLQRGLRLPRLWAQPELSQLPFAFCILHDLGGPALALGSDPTSAAASPPAQLRAEPEAEVGPGLRESHVSGACACAVRPALSAPALSALPASRAPAPTSPRRVRLRLRLRRPHPTPACLRRPRPFECACAKIAPPSDSPTPTSPRPRRARADRVPPPRANAPARRCPATGWTRAPWSGEAAP